ncbi:MAG: AMP-binding protein [Polyangiales bacterium]
MSWAPSPAFGASTPTDRRSAPSRAPTTASDVDPDAGRSHRASAGHARAYVLAPDGSLAPTGVAGDLWIGGPAVSLGYRGKPTLTARVFRPNPFAEGRVYATGDRARWGVDGELEFLGRADREVKVRGYRIDLRHIERALETLPGVQRAVAAVEGSESAARLVAWVSAPGVELDLDALREGAAALLPPHMVPRLAVVDVFPTRPGGKIDMEALWRRRPAMSVLPSRPVDPRTRQVANAMARVLGRTSIGADASFYDEGGHSLLALKLVGELGELGFDVDVADIHRLRTARAIASAESKVDAPRELVAIQPHGTKPPLFGVHVLGRNEEYFRPLAERLGDDQPVFGLTVGAGAPSDVVEVAKLYRHAIEARYPRGPVGLAAVSLGAFYAYELARQLMASGREVRVLALFDASGPGGRRMLRGTRKLVWHVGKLRTRGLPHLGSWWQHRMSEMRHRREMLQLRVARRLGWSLEASSIHTYVAVNALDVAAYRPMPYHGRLTIFHASDEAVDLEHALSTGLGWADVALGGFEVVSVTGSHMSILDEPNVETVALKIREEIDRG